MTKRALAPRAIIVMGVSGSGKTTVGRALASHLGARFVDADDYHSPANKAKMALGIPLDDHDRGPWLGALGRVLADHHEQGAPLIMAASALKATYRAHMARIAGFAPKWVYLQGTQALLQSRLAARQGHFFDPNLLASQLATLEAPENAITVDIDQSPDAIVAEITAALEPKT